MDETAKPLRIPPEMATYADKHEIFDLMQFLMTSLTTDKPDDPIQYLIGLLKESSPDVPRVVLLGPPASGKKTMAKRLNEHTGAIHINASNLLKEDTDLTKQAQQYIETNQACDPSAQHVCLQGWVLAGIPRTREEALCLQEAGVIPEHVVMLEAPDAVLIERSLGKRIDPVTGDIYHVTFIQPDSQEVESRLTGPEIHVMEEHTVSELLKYHRSVFLLQRTYQNCLKKINADQPDVDVFTQVLTHVMSRHHSAALHAPRVLLIGPPGSGKGQQARLIAEKYDLVNIHCGELLRAASADETSVGELIKPYLESGLQVPDNLVLQVLTDRLSKLDCTTRGWVLHSFPRDVEQAQKLRASNFIPSRVFFLEMTADVAMERIALRSVDPVTGERYHSVYKPPPSERVQARLRHKPKDSEGQLRIRLKDYWKSAPLLHEFYPDAVNVNAELPPHSIFELLESHVVRRLPRRLSVSGMIQNMS
uniref:Nucleoside-diphosphate kinase n=1 Tax=Denticeps clupeoides TaxID=299321 RepID=A0AAY4EME5_9TELE